MTPNDDQPVHDFGGTERSTDALAKGEEVLDRARQVAKRITERVRKATADTHPHLDLGPTDDTARNIPLPPDSKG